MISTGNGQAGLWHCTAASCRGLEDCAGPELAEPLQQGYSLMLTPTRPNPPSAAEPVSNSKPSYSLLERTHQEVDEAAGLHTLAQVCRRSGGGGEAGHLGLRLARLSLGFAACGPLC